MKLCLRCNQYFTDNIEQCPTDGLILENVGEDPMVGALVNNRYLIDSVIGNGSSGVVYRANRLGRGEMVVAIKILHSYIGAAGPALDRFLREAQAASRLRNPHIITIWETGVTEDGRPYFVMDYLEGVTLGRIIRDKGQLEPKRVLSIVRQICDALGEAHRQGIIHRDLKPENVILQESDHGHDYVKLLDFGIADSPQHSQSSFRLEKPKTVSGSPAYMSPEQCQGLELDGRSDIYSLGIVVFEMLTGKRPFSQKENVQIMLSHVNDMPRKLSAARPDLNFSEQLDEIIAKALAKQPDERQATVQDFFADLETAIDGLAVKNGGGLKQAVKTNSSNNASFVNVWGNDTCHDIEVSNTASYSSLASVTPDTLSQSDSKPLLSPITAFDAPLPAAVDRGNRSSATNDVIERLYKAAQEAKEAGQRLSEQPSSLPPLPPLAGANDVIEHFSSSSTVETKSDLDAVIAPQDSYGLFEFKPQLEPAEQTTGEAALPETWVQTPLPQRELHIQTQATEINPEVQGQKQQPRTVDARTQGWGKVERAALTQAATGIRAAARKSEKARPPVDFGRGLLILMFIIIFSLCAYALYSVLTPKLVTNIPANTSTIVPSAAPILPPAPPPDQPGPTATPIPPTPAPSDDPAF